MPADAYAGHAPDSTSAARVANPDNVAPADRVGYDPSAFVAQPGAGARAAGYPRHG